MFEPLELPYLYTRKTKKEIDREKSDSKLLTMKNLVILGAGTAGTMMANHLRPKLDKKEWNITIVDQYKTHYYQPGFLFLPFDIY
jgi:pyrimidine operon attenuation protein/uracil phosphoribosyltransferase